MLLHTIDEYKKKSGNVDFEFIVLKAQSANIKLINYYWRACMACV
jgi:hypothetical protein